MIKAIVHILEIICSGLLGVMLTIGYQHFFASSQSFTIILNGEEVVVTESTYTETVEENSELKKKLKTAQEQIDQQSASEEVEKNIQKATAYWNNSQYEQCIIVLKNSKSMSEDIKLLYEQYSDEYVVYLLTQADSLIEQRDYDSAIKILSDGKTIVHSDKKLTDKIAEINDNQPHELSDLKISTHRFFGLNEEPVYDTVGNKYSTGNLFIIHAEGESNYGYGTFFLDKKYTMLSGIIAVSDESENRSDVQLEGWIEIGVKNGDKYTPLWVSETFSRMTSQIEIPEVDISASEWLEIRYYNNGEYWSLAGGHHSLRVIISDLILYKD